MTFDKFKITKAKKSDFKDVAQLLNIVKLPTEGVLEHIENFLLILDNELTILIGCVGLEIYQRNALLRSLAVHPTKQKIGIGKVLTEAIIDFAYQIGIRNLYLRTQTAEYFFLKKGFQKVPLDEIPQLVKQSIEFDSAVCSKSAINMVLSLRK